MLSKIQKKKLFLSTGFVYAAVSIGHAEALCTSLEEHQDIIYEEN
jgi:hypothetical protein